MTPQDRTVGATRGRGRPKDPEAGRAILRAGLELFVERGFEGTSMEQIAKRAGVGKLTVYRRWSSKEELLSRAIEMMVEEPGWPSNDEIRVASPHEILERILPASAEMAVDPRFRALVARILGSSVSHPSLMATYWKHYVAPRRAATSALLENARRDRKVPVDADVDVLMDMMAGAVLYRVLQPNPPDAREMERYLREVYRVAGLLP
ncbi:TetR/AcrR family transcriptional regulator [Pseudonocardia humida]|uniref:TetR/AcrR family transcriptional regulator n=1 Tax=Pseudonocardia humida TaxID=2800819 RepID=A0ABT1A764_9PSEU|nr:TetR/AcrR family transcriptional regulator [Pseudonocardia humida]MCO1658857.1 TetR/AcrR family transcriptional regulator [Pseudonocardia humida]